MVVNPDDYAIVIGIDHYPGEGMRSLSAAEEDAGRFAAWLLHDAGGGLSKDQVRLIRSRELDQPLTKHDARPLKNDVDNALIDFGVGSKKRVGRRLYFYFAGHGLSPSPDNVLMLMANASAYLFGYNLGLREYRNYFLNAAPFQELVFILDCCREFTADATPASPPFTSRRDPGEAPNVKEFVVLAAAYGRKAYEPAMPTSLYSDEPLPTSDERRGLLTQALLEGLERAHTGSFVTTELLERYITDRVPELAHDVNLKQAPHIYGAFSNLKFGKAQVALVSEITFRVWLPAGLGEVVVRDGRFEEIHRCIVSHVPWELELSPGLYEFEDVQSHKRKPVSGRPGQEVVNVEFD